MNITMTELQTYTINATPERYDVSKDENEKRHNQYALIVSSALQSKGIDGFTISEVKGYWQGVAEKSYIITVATDKKAIAIESTCDLLREHYDQDAIMLTYPDGKVAFIEA